MSVVLSDQSEEVQNLPACLARHDQKGTVSSVGSAKANA